jgi:TolB-like protein
MIISMNESLSEQAIREQLTKLLSSEVFARSERLVRFLQFTVDMVLAGRQNEIKEYVIGVEVYDRRSSYNPTADSIVRSEARRLRSKLKRYYEFIGKKDPVRIVFRPGSYTPEIYLQDAGAGDSNGKGELNGPSTGSSDDVVISVDGFVDHCGTSQATIFARGVTTELLHLLMEIKGCRVVPPVSGPVHPARSQLRIEGDTRQYDGILRVTCRLINVEGFQLASHRLDVSAGSARSFVLQEDVAAVMMSRIAPIIRAMSGNTCSPSLPRARVISMVVPEKRPGTRVAHRDDRTSDHRELTGAPLLNGSSHC